MQPTNLYFPSAATSVVNAGTGTNTLTKPAGVEVASIAPGSKYSRRINGPATFTTDFYSDERTFTVWFCAKPNVGVLAEMMGHEFVYTGYSFVLSNNAGSRVEIPEESPSSHVFVLSYADTEMSLIVDGQRATVDGNTLSGIDQIDVSLLNDGGILHIVGAVNTQYNAADLLSAYSIAPPIPSTVSQLSDNERADVNRTVIIDSMYVTYTYTRLLESVECLGFKVNFKQVGEGTVFINGDPVESGDFISGSPQSLMLMPEGEFTVSDLVITEYYSEYVGETSGADVLVNGATGSGLQAFRQDDDGGARGEITVTIDEEVNAVGGWFRAVDGSPLPGVAMTNGVLTGSDLYVNGKPYSGQTLQGWYFLARNATLIEPFNITVPVHSLFFSEDVMSVNDVDDLYESFFGNPRASAGEEVIHMIEQPALIVSTEWNIVASG